MINVCINIDITILSGESYPMFAPGQYQPKTDFVHLLKKPGVIADSFGSKNEVNNGDLLWFGVIVLGL